MNGESNSATSFLILVIKCMMHTKMFYAQTLYAFNLCKTGAYVLTISNCMWYLLIDSDAAGFHLIPDI